LLKKEAKRCVIQVVGLKRYGHRTGISERLFEEGLEKKDADAREKELLEKAKKTRWVCWLHPFRGNGGLK